MEKSKTILLAFENIVKHAHNSGLNNDFYANADPHIKYASRKLKLKPIETIMLALFIDRSEQSRIRGSEIAKYLGCSTIRFLSYEIVIDTLVEKHYIRRIKDRKSICYFVPFEVLDALKDNKPYIYTHQPIDSTEAFFDRVNYLFNEFSDNLLSHSELRSRTKEMLIEIKHTIFARTLLGYNFSDENTLLFVFMAHLFVQNNDNRIGFHDLDDIYDNNELPYMIKSEFRNRNSVLFKYQLIENAFDDGMACSDSFKLTNKAKTELLGELNLSSQADLMRGLITPDTISPKTLIYNPAEQQQVDQLQSILTPERFTQLQQRLRQAGMRQGFCCLFYGAPGTGKTETVNQLARLTGRSIMRVDVDKIKSAWVGESEKNIKELFTRYRDICQKSTLAPILLFNEADAVLGLRMEEASRAVDKMENSIQNIILQEMETLPGIMIATTNLTINLDKAFERRFLYKIRFERPNKVARAQIWQAMFDGLSAHDANTLATQFDLSGGEIENIVRKHTISTILSGNNQIDLNQIINTCHQERIASTARPHIGF